MSAAMELTGKHAEIRINNVKVLDAYDVTVEISNTFLEPRPFSQDWKKRIPDESDFTVGAKKYALVGNIGQSLSLAAATQAAGGANTRVPATVDVYQTEGDSSTRVFSGPVWVEKGTFAMPNGLIDEDISFVAADKPTYVGGTGYVP